MTEAPSGNARSSLGRLLVEHATHRPDEVAVRRRTGAPGASVWEDVTWRGLLGQVRDVARGLLAAGVAPGDRVGLMSPTRYEWTLCDLAIWTAGAVTVPIYETSSAEQTGWILADSGAVACFVAGRGHARTVASLGGDVPDLRHTWAFEAAEGTPSLAELVASGAAVADDRLDARLRAVDASALATIIYTSGTTGRPKGCELTHGNFLAECEGAVAALPELFEGEDAATLLFLPLAHVFGRMVQVACVLNGTTFGHSDIGRLVKDLDTFRPTFVLAVPRVFEKVYDGARRKAVAAGRERVFDVAAETAVTYSRALERQATGGPGPGPVHRARRAVCDRLVYAKLRAALGGRTAWAISGGAPLGERLGHFFRGAGVTVLEGYGLTETTAACTVNTRGATRIGSVGRPLPGVEVRIAADGEVQVRGGHVFGGYWRNSEASAEAFTPDRWFRTGDLGTVDDRGYLTITGRAKEIIVLSSGKNVAPAALEDVVRGHPLVSQCMVVGDTRASVAALVTLDAEAVAAWLTSRGRPQRAVAELTEDPELVAEVQEAVDRANAAVSGAEAVRRFTVLPVDLTEEAGHLTPTLKVKRAVVAAQFAPEIEALYAPAVRRAS